jgi:AmiR/NasT family two-component response regulator
MTEYVGVHVHQATGMVAAQVGCDIEEAFNRLMIRAAALNQSLELTALDVIDRVIRFSP